SITGMGIPTTIAFIVLGFTFAACAWESEGPQRALPDWLPPAAGIAALATTVIIWRALSSEQAEAARTGIRAEARVARQLVETRLAGHVRYLRRMARWSAEFPGLPPSEWSRTFSRVFPDEPDFTSAVWLDTTAQVRARAYGRDPGADFSRMMFLLRGEGRVSPREDVRMLLETTPEGALQLAVAAPVCAPEGRCHGHLVAHLDPTSLLRGALAALTPGFATSVSVGGHAIFRSDTASQPGSWVGLDTLRVGGQSWTVSAWPLDAQRRLYSSDLPQVVAVLGVLMSMLIAATLKFAHSRYDMARQVERERLEQALASSTDGVWEYDFRTDETILGASMLRRLGYEPHAITPRALTTVWLELTHP
ncbi:MAG TPA: hypothetical protein VFX50_02790, partial [Gemmatimonadales bacterium]|nr:hypothetical protein [Gemmatimonadales bacterium]